MSAETRIDYLDCPVDLMRSDLDTATIMRHVLYELCVTAARQGWNIEDGSLYVLRRTERWDMTVRLARAPTPDLLATWTARGWIGVAIDDAMRAQLIGLLPKASV